MLGKNAITVLEKRYLKKNEEGKIVETPEQLFRRVAKAVAAADLKYGKTKEEVKDIEEQFYTVMTDLDFLPNSPTLMNAGTRLGMLSACFVVPVEDSMESIFDAVKEAAIINKSGGGTGFAFSKLRPKGDVVGSTGGVASGPISFMEVFNSATNVIKQGGKRRGANMGVLRIDSPDILEFITCKDDCTKLNNFNLSVAITDDFMKAAEEDTEYDLINPATCKPVGRLKARMVFDMIVRQAWKNGEPGVIFIDTINRANPLLQLGEIEATNPCGEQPLFPNESCNLGSINLANMVKCDVDRYPVVDWDKLERTVSIAVHFLDNVIDVNKYPLRAIEETTKANRKIGLGVMGWADMLIKLGIPYNSDEALVMAEAVMEFIRLYGRGKSRDLAMARGAFPNWEKSSFYPQDIIRNATITTIAPTGTLSIIAGCSSGIEPLFAVAYSKNVMDNVSLIEINHNFKEAMDLHGGISEEVMGEILKTPSLSGVSKIPAEVRRIFVTSHDISPDIHVKMQACFQKFVDNAVSKTINLPSDATERDVAESYKLAYKLGCKGITVYRDGSRDGQVLTSVEKVVTHQTVQAKKRPTIAAGTTRGMKTGCGNIYITINNDDLGNPIEVFTNIGKAGGCASSQSEAIGRLISLALRSGTSPSDVVKQLRGISCHQQVWAEGGKILSCADAIAKALASHISDAKIYVQQSGACPDCGGTLEYREGCVHCRECGYSRCA